MIDPVELVRTHLTHPWMLPVAVLASVSIAWLGWQAEARRRRRLASLGDVPVLERLLPAARAGLPLRLRGVLLALATLGLGLALSGPHWGEQSDQRRDAGVDLVLVLDVSASMLATDESGSRLEQMKSDVRRLLATMTAARVAIVVVAGKSYVLTPLTADHDALTLFLDGLDPGMVSQGGTALAVGIAQAGQLLGSAAPAGDRAIVVMSDGETWDEPDEIASAVKAARDAHLSIVTVGYGTPAGANIPMPGGGVKRDADGAAVITHANPVTLQTIARGADGVFVDAVSADRPGRVRSALRRLRETERTYNAGVSPVQRYQWFLWPAFLLLLADALLADRRWPRLWRARTAAVLLIAAAGAPGLSAQERDARADPVALFRQRKFAESAASLRQRLRNGDRSARSMYNLGTALLEADSIGAATELLDRVVTIAPDTELRFRALFNLGLANLRRGRATKGGDAAPYYAAAVTAYKRALRARTDDADARWNLELALREQQRASGGGGGGGQQPPPPQPPPQKGEKDLEKQRAASVLSSAARDERDVQSRRQRDMPRRDATNGRDW